MRRARGEKESLELARGGARFGTTEAIEKCLSTFLRGADLSVTAPSTVEQVLHAPPFATGRHQDLRVQRAVQCARARRGRTSLRARWEQAAGSEAHESKNSACPARLRRGFGASLRQAFLRLTGEGPFDGVNIHGQSDFGAGGWQLREERLLQS